MKGGAGGVPQGMPGMGMPGMGMPGMGMPGMGFPGMGMPAVPGEGRCRKTFRGCGQRRRPNEMHARIRESANETPARRAKARSRQRGQTELHNHSLSARMVMKIALALDTLGCHSKARGAAPRADVHFWAPPEGRQRMLASEANKRTNPSTYNRSTNGDLARSPFAIDGVLDEPVWAFWRRVTGEFINVGTGKPNESHDIGGRARLLWNGEAFSTWRLRFAIPISGATSCVCCR